MLFWYLKPLWCTGKMVRPKSPKPHQIKAKKLHPSVQKKINNFKQLNPEYTYHLYDDKDMDDFVNEHFNGEIAECYNKLNIIVAKVDFWRYLVVYKYGGIYLETGYLG